MAGLGAKYAAILGAIMLLFVNFVACGAQMYQTSLKEDHVVESIPQAAFDPNSERYGVHALHGWRELPIHFRVGMRLDADQKRGLIRAMNTWRLAVGKDLFFFEGVHEGVDGDSFKELYDSLADRINGHYLDENWQKTKKPVIVLATTIWENASDDWEAIDTADIRFNHQYYKIGDALTLTYDGEREVVDMETLALHELGHLLGLTHVDRHVDPDSIMNPSLYIGEGLYNRRLSRGDIERVQKIYGCAGPSCDVSWVLEQIDAQMLAHTGTSDLTETAH